MLRKSKNILPILAVILLSLLTSIEAHIFFTELDVIKDAQEEQEAKKEKEIDELREWKVKQHKTLFGGGHDGGHDGGYAQFEYTVLLHIFVDTTYIKLKQYFSHYSFANDLGLYVWFCSLKVDC